MAKVSIYLNFPGTTEEAFNFYKSVFGGEFGGEGMMRFGGMPPMEGQPPLSDELKNMVVHVELPILNSFTIMGTDAPEEMGFTVEHGNNMHINLHPDNRTDTKRIFDRLSEGGKVTMELQEMFWGDYFGSCTDKYGINWMVACASKE